MISTGAVFVALWAAADAALDVFVPLSLTIAVVNGLVLTRLFVLFYDCTHGSLFRREWANFLVGSTIGVLTMTPFEAWKHDHVVHHATTGDLDRRGTGGDITTWTVVQYREASPTARLAYRISRNPFAMMLGGAAVVFGIGYRFPAMFVWGPNRREKIGIHVTTVLGISVWAFVVVAFGWQALWLVHAPALVVGAATGIFLFYVQHQFPTVYWRHHDEWDYVDACMHGSSYVRMNRVLRWFTADIGVHHIHHLAPKIPNYRLQQCHDDNPTLQRVATLDVRDAIGTLRLKLYDEDRGELVPL